MASYLIILMALLYFNQGSALQCYTCMGDSCHGKDQRSTNCSSSDAYCETIVITAKLDTHKLENIIQKCSSTCEPSNTTLGVLHVTSQCCNSTLCNSNGVTHVTASCGAVVLAVLTCIVFPLFGSRL
ncbi:glycosylphosphatidylinositol-anchored high density lipoprotein-binding protein 1-like [Notamacropus eugenii]|uniref:glycosylphosphatidylinositol-anchored high density lipoprotein-binding protein 1-like n=1 Tax=Notamacropus eugenii TaxID=9315 RepID=UPI003B682B26